MNVGKLCFGSVWVVNAPSDSFAMILQFINKNPLTTSGFTAGFEKLWPKISQLNEGIQS